MSNINSLVLRVEELLQQHRQLQQENQALRGQIISLQEQQSLSPSTPASAALNDDDLQTLHRLHDLLDDNLGDSP